MTGPLLFGILTAVTIFCVFLGIWRLLVRRRDPVGDRLQGYGGADLEGVEGGGRARFAGTARLVNGFGLGPRLNAALAQSDLRLTAAEFAFLVIVVGAIGFALGTLRLNLLAGIAAGALFAALPIFYLRFAQSRRRRAFASQLPEVLTLLVGGLRAGYGLSQALEVLVEQMPAPASTEFGRTLRAVNLGAPLPRALTDMSARVGNDDLDLMVTAINVQYETGGNLAYVLETIGATIRDRIRILREIQVLTAQQRFTGYLLVGTPIFLAIAINVISPDYYDPFFEPGWVQFLPLLGGLMLVVGFFIIRRIVDIEV